METANGYFARNEKDSRTDRDELTRGDEMDKPVKYYRTVFKFEVLSTDPGFGNAGLSLSDINYEITQGHASGVFLETEHEEVSKTQMHTLLLNQESDPNFLIKPISEENQND